MMMKDGIIVKHKKIELVPPDGGWGYMIWIAAIINYSVGTMFLGCFGMLYNDFIVQLNMGSACITALGGVNAVALAIMGYMTSPLLKILSLRNCAYLGSFLFNLGVLLTVFANSKVELFIYQGFLQYGGFGILYNLSTTLLNDYFMKKRFLSVCLTQTMAAVATMIAPQFVKWSLEEYGFRGTLILISALSLQSFVAAVLIQPVDWHMKRIEVAGDAEKINLLLADEKTDNSKNITTPIITFTDIERSFDEVAVKSEDDNNVPGKGEIKREIEKIFKEMWDLNVMKKFFTTNSSIGPPICITFDYIFFLLLPQSLYSIGWDKVEKKIRVLGNHKELAQQRLFRAIPEDQVAQAIFLIALADLVTRTSFILFSNWLTKIGSQEIYVIGIAIAVGSKFAMLWSENVTVLLIYMTLMGISRFTITVLPPLVLADTFTSSQFSSAMGMFMMMIGALNLIVGPAIGAVRDMTDSYPTAFYIITSCLSVVLLMWTIELIYKKNKDRRKLQEIARHERALKKNKSKA